MDGSPGLSLREPGGLPGAGLAGGGGAAVESLGDRQLEVYPT